MIATIEILEFSKLHITSHARKTVALPKKKSYIYFVEFIKSKFNLGMDNDKRYWPSKF